MDYGRIIFAIIGFSTSLIFYIPNLKRQQKREITLEKLKVVSEALKHAEERVIKFQERHDKILSQMCSYYLSHQDLGEALVGSRAAMNEALAFVVKLRDLQFKILVGFPEDVDLSSMLIRRGN